MFHYYTCGKNQFGLTNKTTLNKYDTSPSIIDSG